MGNDDTDFTVSGARSAADEGRLDRWVADFLASPGSDNADLADTLLREMTQWRGPVRLPFSELHRLGGPPDEPTLARLDDDDLDTVEDMGDSIDDGWDPPPLIVTHRGGQLVVEDGNHRVEGLRRAGESDYWAVVCSADTDADGLDDVLEQMAR